MIFSNSLIILDSGLPYQGMISSLGGSDPYNQQAMHRAAEVGNLQHTIDWLN
jgi:hypothetical protein